MAVTFRVIVTRRDAADNSSTREEFWAPLQKEKSEYERPSPAVAEGKLVRDLPSRLHNALTQSFDDALRRPTDRVWDDWDYVWRRLRDTELREKTAGENAAALAFARLAELRLHEWRDTPALREAAEKRSRAAQVWFAIHNISYRSLIFDLDVGPIEKLAAVFDNDFESFQVFLNAFIPVTFGYVFTSDFANLHEFNVSEVARTRTSFDVPVPGVPLLGDAQTASQMSTPPPTAIENTKPPETPKVVDRAREKAEWLWRLANGSLLVPVLILLFVMFYAIRELAAIRQQQLAMLAPLLQHSVELLKEDRARLSPPSSPTAVPNSAIPSQASPAPTTTTAGK